MSLEPRWMTDLRSKATRRFQSMEWPTPEEEEWRRTDLAGLDLLSYEPATREPAAARPGGGKPVSVPVSRGHAPPRRTEDEVVQPPAGRIVLKGGASASLEVAHTWRNHGVKLMELAQALEEFPEPLEEVFTAGLQAADNRLIVWHYANWSHGALLYVPPFLEIAEPFVIELDEMDGKRFTAPHVVVLLAEGARATVVQRIRGEGDSESLCNAMSDLRLSASAALRWYECQALGDRSLYFRHASAELDRDAHLEHFDTALGGRLVKSRLDCGLAGPGAEAYLNGIYFLRGEQHMDIRTVQRHRCPRGTSRAFYKGAVKDASRVVFQGLIEVSAGASGTDAFLTNRNLILNEGARADSIPSLKIGNNDVKCSHGSTVGRISEEELFYLMTRGLPRAEARELLVLGYFDELLAKTPDQLRGAVLPLLRSRLKALS